MSSIVHIFQDDRNASYLFFFTLHLKHSLAIKFEKHFCKILF